MAAAPEKAPITCHILDTTEGRPARNVRVQLQQTLAQPHHPSSNPVIFESLTDDDGRVKTWLPYSSPLSSGEVPVYTLEDVLGDIKGDSRWTLRFDTGAYFSTQQKETFFPEVCIVFEVKEGQHYHVPLLLSPFGYSTYRGS